MCKDLREPLSKNFKASSSANEKSCENESENNAKPSSSTSKSGCGCKK